VVFIHNKIPQQMKFCHLQVNGWNLRTSASGKLVRLRRPKVTWSPSFADYRPKINAAVLWEICVWEG
jgi:hypothetical protein